jgi:hypothetical protein
MMLRQQLVPRGIWGLTLLLCCAAALADQDKILQFTSAMKKPIKGQEHLILLANRPHGRVTRLVVANSDPAGPFAPVVDQAQLISSLKPGDLIEASWDSVGTLNTISAIARYTPRPGELTPNGYVFVKAESKDESSSLAVVLNKLGEVTNATAPAEKDAKGDTHRDPLIDATVAALHEGDSVWVDLPTGSPPTLLAILPYADPTAGKLVKIDTTEANGNRASTVEIDTNGAGISAVIPGKLVSGKWIPNIRIASAAHRCRPGEQIFYRVQQDGTTTWLRDIQPQPGQPVAQQQPNTPGTGSNVDANGVPKGRTIGGGNQIGGFGGIGGF